MPGLKSKAGGFGAHMQPIFRLLQAKPSPQWGAREKGALRSAFANRQWTQCRLHSAGMASTKNCRLCVQLGYCTQDDPDPRHWGTLMHRIWTCPATESIRSKMVPAWLYAEVKRAMRLDGTMAPADLALYTRALVASPAAFLEPPPSHETFEWVHRPADGCVTGRVYVDGSRIDGEWFLAGMCARHGWAFAAYDDDGMLLAAAKGRPPAWADGIYGAELWGLFMAATEADPWAPLRVDCMSVQLGTQNGQEWAAAPNRCLARVWAPLSAALDDDPQRVVWMPAHCIQDAIGTKRLGNGELLSELDVKGNAFVDKLAKEAARFDRLPRAQLAGVRKLGEKLTAVAMWIGQATQLANAFPDPNGTGAGKQQLLRDSEALQGKRPRQQRQVGVVQLEHPAGISGLTTNERWEALHQRICAKEQAQPGRADVLLDAPSSLAILHAERVVSAGGMQEAGQRRGQKRTAPSRYTGNSTASWPQPQWNAHATACEAGLHQASLGCDSQHKWLRRTGPDAQGAGEQQLRDEEVQSDTEAVRRDLEELQASGLQVRWPRCQPLCRSAGGGSKGPARHAQPRASPCSPQPGRPVKADDAALNEELDELERSGLKVVC